MGDSDEDRVGGLVAGSPEVVDLQKGFEEDGA